MIISIILTIKNVYRTSSLMPYGFLSCPFLLSNSTLNATAIKQRTIEKKALRRKENANQIFSSFIPLEWETIFTALCFIPKMRLMRSPPSTHLMAINCLKHQLARRSASFALLQKGGKLMNYGRRITIKNPTKRSSLPIKTRQNDCWCRLKSDKTAPFRPAVPLEIHTLQRTTAPPPPLSLCLV